MLELKLQPPKERFRANVAPKTDECKYFGNSVTRRIGGLGQDSSLAGIEEDVVGVRNSAQEADASTGFVKFVNVFDPNVLVIGEFPENLVRGRHL
jgi:hypothetical protein